MVGAGPSARPDQKKMSLSSIEDAVKDIRDGKMIIIVDDEDRENEGDLVCAAEKVTPEIINFMATHGRGLICLPLTEERCEELQLIPQTSDNTSSMGTAFTISIEAREGVTTGISAADRATTILKAVDPASRAAASTLSRAWSISAACLPQKSRFQLRLAVSEPYQR